MQALLRELSFLKVFHFFNIFRPFVFFIIFASILASIFDRFLVPIPSKTSSKNHPKNTSNFASIFHRFSMDLGPHFRPKLAHVGAKLAILAPLGPPLAALGRHLGSKVLPRRPPEPPGPPQTSIFIDLGTIFKRIWVKFSMIFLEPRFQNRDRHGGGFARVANWIRRPRVAGQAV